MIGFEPKRVKSHDDAETVKSYNDACTSTASSDAVKQTKFIMRVEE